MRCEMGVTIFTWLGGMLQGLLINVCNTLGNLQTIGPTYSDVIGRYFRHN